VEGVNSSLIYLKNCKNFCKCHNLPLPSTTIKEKKNKRLPPVLFSRSLFKIDITSPLNI
jgi:hypothetical protein